jgi:hypothetical protein
MNATRKLTEAIAQPRAMRAAKALERLKGCVVEYPRSEYPDPEAQAQRWVKQWREKHQAYEEWLGLATAGEVRRHHRSWMGKFPQWAE